MRHGAIARHVGELRHQRVWAAGKRLEDTDLREPVQLLDGLRDHLDQLKLFRGRSHAVQLHDTVRKVQLGVAAAHTRHVAVDDRTEFFAGFWLQLARGVALIGDEFAGEHAFAAEGVFMAACNGQQIDQRIKVPQPVMDGCRRQHQHIAEAPFLERLPEAHRDLRRRINTVEVAQLMRLVQH